ncbi:MAG: phosphatidate cytidylyltransferase [Pontiellaceae bacterium]|nr:phosphatidate cytidylyltransferase [Pontiellaceae bacterium]
MDEITKNRLFGIRTILDDAVSLWIVAALVAVLVASAVTIRLLAFQGKLRPETVKELSDRTRTWAFLIGVVLVPLILGAAWVIIGVGALSIMCYREFARATGLFRDLSTSVWVVVGIGVITLAVLDHWYGFFVALPALGTIWIAAFAILSDRPKGYIQRVGLGCLAYLLFGVCLGHLGYLANDARFRSMILLVLVSVSLNDVFAYLAGKSLGHRKILPMTSPNKTLAGVLGALCCTTILMVLLGLVVFQGTPMAHVGRLIGLGLIVSLAGQLGDLVISSVKRDLGVKDMGNVLPGHGGILDRCDSLLLVAPAFFHYVGYFIGIGLDQPMRIFHGG